MIPMVITYGSIEAGELLLQATGCFLLPSFFVCKAITPLIASKLVQAQRGPPHGEGQVDHWQLVFKDARHWVHLDFQAHPRISAKLMRT